MDYAYDPQLVAGLQFIPPVDFNDIPGSRAASDAVAELWETLIDRSGVDSGDASVPHHIPGEPDVPVRIHRPVAGSAPRSVIIDFHGGGFAVGSPRATESGCVALSRAVGAVVVSVDYRLAPEHPYPAAIEDAYSVLVWITQNAEALNVEPGRLAVVGQSAGGGIAAGLTLLARDRGGPQIAFQYLGVPEIDDTLDQPSMRDYSDTPFWSRPNALISWGAYLGDAVGSDVPIYAAPLRASVDELVGLPPAYISAMQFDPLRDEGLAYASLLAQANVPVELHLFPGTFHASFVIGDAEVSQRELAEQVRVLADALAPRP